MFKKGAEVELSYENMSVPVLEKAPIGKFHKAVLKWATVVYKNREEDDVLLRLPPDTLYLEDRSY